MILGSNDFDTFDMLDNRVMLQYIHHVANIEVCGFFVYIVRMFGFGCRDSRLDLRCNSLDVGRNFTAVDSGLYGTALFVAHYDDQLGAQILNGILDAAQFNRVKDIAGHANNEKVAEALVKNVLRRNTAVRTAYNNSKGMLSFG